MINSKHMHIHTQAKMSSNEVVASKPHILCIPLPLQSHIKAMLKFSKLLHHRGFHITFVNTEFNHRRFLKSLGPKSLDGLRDFKFETIPDGLPSTDDDTPQDVVEICDAVRTNFLAPFRELLAKLNGTASSDSEKDGNPNVTHIVSDGWNAFALTAGEEYDIPVTLLFTIAACGFMGYAQFPTLVEKGLAPLPDVSSLTNGYLDKVIDWIPGMKGICLKDLPTNLRVTDPENSTWNFCLEGIEGIKKASAVVVHTFDALEPQILKAFSTMLPVHVYAIGPQQLLLDQIGEHPLNSMGYSLWKEETHCLEWLNSKPKGSVVYVNFGSLTLMTPNQLVEFAWGLANARVPFFWVIRPDLVIGESAILPREFVVEIKDRGMIASWCPQEEVLGHFSIGGFLTHSGWNSTIESLCAGVPMLCWPFFADQQMNCWFACNVWEIGMEISNDVKRDEVKRLVRDLMEGKKSEEMKTRVMELKKLAEEATGVNGSSSKNLDDLVNHMLLKKT